MFKEEDEEEEEEEKKKGEKALNKERGIFSTAILTF